MHDAQQTAASESQQHAGAACAADSAWAFAARSCRRQLAASLQDWLLHTQLQHPVHQQKGFAGWDDRCLRSRCAFAVVPNDAYGIDGAGHAAGCMAAACAAPVQQQHQQ